MTTKLTRSEIGKLGSIASAATANKAKAERIAAYNLNPILCEKCCGKIDYARKRNRFCSRSCAGIEASNNLPKRKRTKQKISCLYCESATTNEKYCSVECDINHKRAKKAQEVINGTASPRRIRSYLLDTKYECSRCLNTEWQGEPIPLELEHKDGNSENNTLDNCVLLCPNCHALTPTYKNRNKGNGRASGRQRYKDGKSY